MKKKWNWIDTAIIIFIVVAIVSFLNRDKILNNNNSSVNPNRKDIIITVEANELTADMVTELKIGDQIFSQNSLQSAFVQDIIIEPRLLTVVGHDGIVKAYKDSEEITINVILKAEVSTSGPYMDLGGQEIKVGLPIIMKTTSVEFLGNIKNIEVN